jgi:hypothetical protein
MTLKRAYILLALFYSALLLVGLIALLAGAGSPIALVQLGVGSVAVIGLWGAVLGKGFLNATTWRPLTGVLAVGVLIQMFAVFNLSVDGATLTWLLSGAIFSAMLAIILYGYGDRDQDLWASSHALEGGERLSALLEAHEPLEVDKQEGDRRAQVRVSRSGDAYRVSVTRRTGEREERFEERFRRPSTLAAFIEAFTCVEVGDFVRRYRDDGASPA